MSGVNIYFGKFKGKSIILLVDKDTNVLNHKKEAVITTIFSWKKVLKTDRFTTNYDVHKRNEKISTREEIDKGSYEVHKRTEKLQQVRR